MSRSVTQVRVQSACLPQGKVKHGISSSSTTIVLAKGCGDHRIRVLIDTFRGRSLRGGGLVGSLVGGAAGAEGRHAKQERDRVGTQHSNLLVRWGPGARADRRGRRARLGALCRGAVRPSRGRATPGAPPQCQPPPCGITPPRPLKKTLGGRVRRGGAGPAAPTSRRSRTGARRTRCSAAARQHQLRRAERVLLLGPELSKIRIVTFARFSRKHRRHLGGPLLMRT